jgi:hypothetical protein
VLGDDEVFEQLDRYLPGRTIGDRPIVARRLGRLDDLADDEILFVGRDTDRSLETLLSLATVSSDRLIVTDLPDGIVAGAMINFRLLGGRVRFEIDRRAAAEAGLTLSSRLLAAAFRVTGDP